MTTRNEAAERLRERLPEWVGIEDDLDAALAEERRLVVGQAKSKVRAQYGTLPTGDRVCAILDETEVTP